MHWSIVTLGVGLAFFITAHTCGVPDWLKRVYDRHPTPHWRGRLAHGLLAIIALSSFAGLEGISLDPFNMVIFTNFAWIGLSILWADDKRLSARRIVQGALVACVALSVASAYPLPDRVMLVAVCSGAFMALGVTEALRTSQFPVGENGRFSGTVAPNKQGTNAVLFILSLTYLVELGKMPVTVGVFLILAGLFLLFLTRARTPIWAGFFAVLAWSAISLARSPDTGSWLILAMPSLYLTAAWIVNALPVILRPPVASEAGAFQALIHCAREPVELWTLNLRLPLWRHVLSVVRKRWLLGFGYGGFWNRERSLAYANWAPESSHSAYVETLAGTGCVGLGLFAALIVVAVLTALSAASPGGPFVLAVVVFVALHGLLEVAFVFPEFDAFVFLTLILNLGQTVDLMGYA